MSGTITVSSTTDSQEEVNKAAEYGEQTLPFTEEEKPGTPSEVEETETGTAADSEPAELPENEEEEEAPEEEPEEPETAQSASQPMGQTRKGLAAQVRRLAAENRELRDQVRKQLPQEPQPAAPPQPDYSKRPDESDPKYIGKLGDFVHDMQRHANFMQKQEEAEQQKADLQRQRQNQSVEYLRDYNERQIPELRAKYADFQTEVDKVAADIPEELQRYIIEQFPNAGEVAYYLAKHPDDVEQIVEWHQPSVRGGPTRIAHKIQGISSQLAGDESAPASSSSPRSPQPRPAAPRPLRHVGGASTAATSTVDPSNMTYRQYDDWRKAGGGR